MQPVTSRNGGLDELMLSKADRTVVEITLPPEGRNELTKIEGYLKYLSLWMLVGPLVYFVVWIRLSEFKLVWMQSSRRQPNQQRGNGVETAAEMETRVMEEGELSIIEHSQLHSLATEETVTNAHTENEMQPLLNGVRCGSNTRQRQRRCIIIRKCFCKVLVGLCYLILMVAALPVGISNGGLSFFRFDQGDNSFPEDNYFFNLTVVAFGKPVSLNRFVALLFGGHLPVVLLFPLQLLCT